MALVSTIFGSIFGCLCFLVALMLFKVSFAAAFGLYMGVASLDGRCHDDDAFGCEHPA